MSTTAFCNFFKRKTGKTVITYINEYRIAQACKMLISTDKNIGEIAFECGFNNISNFNRTFKSIIGKTPGTYRVLWSGNS
jgi:AraC-like DNA-binding protein